MITTPRDRIVWELERQPWNGRMGLVVEVLQRMGITTPARTDFLSRTGRLWVVLGVIVLGGGLGVWTWVNAFARARLEVTTEPAEARVFIDGDPVLDRARSAIIVRPGRHTLSVTMPGYDPSDQDIEIGLTRTLRKRVELTPSAKTGFELRSDPTGMQALLDGEPLKGDSGPAVTPLHLHRVAPGPHVLELRGPLMFWQEWVVIEPDRLRKIQAVMKYEREPFICTGPGGDPIERGRKRR